LRISKLRCDKRFSGDFGEIMETILISFWPVRKEGCRICKKRAGR
jgi:hypothetical protein